MKQTIVIVEDNEEMAIALSFLITDLCSDIHIFKSAEQFLQNKTEMRASLFLIDHGLPGMNGSQLIDMIKAREPLAMVFMISFNREIEQIKKVYKLGADHYITKPFDPIFLRIKIENALNRARNTFSVNINKGLKLIPEASVLSYDGYKILLSQREYSIFEHLYKTIGKISSRKEILSVIGTHCEERNVDTYISDLRKLLTQTPLEIKSIRGSGYRLVL